MSRLIDADALKKALVDFMDAFIDSDGDMMYSDHLLIDADYIALCDYIDKQPTFTPEPQWIPCSERMPEEHEWIGTKQFGTTISDEVYVTFENPKGERFCRHLSFQNGKVNGYDQRFIDAICKGSRPVAWMPLPEPYKGMKE